MNQHKLNFKKSLRAPFLYKKGIILGYKRSIRNQKTSKVRIQIKEPMVKTPIKSLIGKKIFYTNSKNKKKWGKVCSTHGVSGSLLAKFKKKVAPSSFLSPVFIEFIKSQPRKLSLFKQNHNQNILQLI